MAQAKATISPTMVAKKGLTSANTVVAHSGTLLRWSMAGVGGILTVPVAGVIVRRGREYPATILSAQLIEEDMPDES
jgi:hypothetical protein